MDHRAWREKVQSYKRESCVTTLGCCWGLTVSTEVPQHHGVGHCIDTETFSSNLARMGRIVNTRQWEATAQ